jgi:hypothetical protein
MREALFLRKVELCLLPFSDVEINADPIQLSDASEMINRSREAPSLRGKYTLGTTEIFSGRTPEFPDIRLDKESLARNESCVVRRSGRPFPL